MIGIIFATEMEARPFLERGEPDGVVTIISGMGMVAAQEATEKLVTEHRCSLVINAGVCGALNEDLERGKVYRIAQTDVETFDDCSEVQSEGLRLVSVDKPVFELERKRRLSAHADLVDMEGHAVAQVCDEHGVSCVMLKGVTDFGDDQGKADIKKHIDLVSESVAEVVIQHLNSLGAPKEPTGFWKKIHSFTKVEHTIFSLPLLFAGAWIGVEGMPTVKALLLIAMVGLGARTFGMAVNRILDRRIDAKNPRTKNRELAAGTLSMVQGYGVAIVGLLIYFIGCALLGGTVFKLSLFPLVPLSVYSLLKRFTPLCHYGIGVCLAVAPVGAFVGVTNSLAFPPTLFLLSVFTFFWISGFDIIYALLDEGFDREHGVRSVPAALGATGAQWVAAVSHLFSIVALSGLWSMVGGPWSFLALLVSIGAFIAGYVQRIPVAVRFFPISSVAGIAGALVVLLGG